MHGAVVHGAGDASDWIVRWCHLIPANGRVLDVACGAGRHTHHLLKQGFQVTAVDRDPVALAAISPQARVVQANLEADAWPFAEARFDAIVVTNYLWRPLLPVLIGAVAQGGLLLYETFTLENAALGRPRNPQFLLQPGELLQAVAGRLQVVAFEEGYLPDPPREIQRIAAVAPATGDASRRWALGG